MTTLRYLSLWLVQLHDARIRRHQCPELVEFVNSGMLFAKGRYLDPQILQQTVIHVMKNLSHDNSCLDDIFHVLDNAF